jgi:hypothetical protein
MTYRRHMTASPTAKRRHNHRTNKTILTIQTAGKYREFVAMRRRESMKATPERRASDLD